MLGQINHLVLCAQQSCLRRMLVIFVNIMLYFMHLELKTASLHLEAAYN